MFSLPARVLWLALVCWVSLARGRPFTAMHDTPEAAHLETSAPHPHFEPAAAGGDGSVACPSNRMCSDFSVWAHTPYFDVLTPKPNNSALYYPGFVDLRGLVGVQRSPVSNVDDALTPSVNQPYRMQQIVLGFNFPFYGYVWDRVYLSPNGFVSMLPFDCGPDQGYCGWFAGYWYYFTVAAFMTDLNPPNVDGATGPNGPAGNVYYRLMTQADGVRALVVQFQDVYLYWRNVGAPPGVKFPFTFQFALREDGGITFAYAALPFNPTLFTNLNQNYPLYMGTQGAVVTDFNPASPKQSGAFGIVSLSWDTLNTSRHFYFRPQSPCNTFNADCAACARVGQFYAQAPNRLHCAFCPASGVCANTAERDRGWNALDPSCALMATPNILTDPNQCVFSSSAPFSSSARFSSSRARTSSSSSLSSGAGTGSSFSSSATGAGVSSSSQALFSSSAPLPARVNGTVLLDQTETIDLLLAEAVTVELRFLVALPRDPHTGLVTSTAVSDFRDRLWRELGGTGEGVMYAAPSQPLPATANPATQIAVLSVATAADEIGNGNGNSPITANTDTTHTATHRVRPLVAADPLVVRLAFIQPLGRPQDTTAIALVSELVTQFGYTAVAQGDSAFFKAPALQTVDPGTPLIISCTSFWVLHVPSELWMCQRALSTGVVVYQCVVGGGVLVTDPARCPPAVVPVQRFWESPTGLGVGVALGGVALLALLALVRYSCKAYRHWAAHHHEVWVRDCLRCTYQNPAHRVRCELCEAALRLPPRRVFPAGQPPPPPPPQPQQQRDDGIRLDAAPAPGFAALPRQRQRQPSLPPAEAAGDVGAGAGAGAASEAASHPYHHHEDHDHHDHDRHDQDIHANAVNGMTAVSQLLLPRPVRNEALNYAVYQPQPQPQRAQPSQPMQPLQPPQPLRDDGSHASLLVPHVRDIEAATAGAGAGADATGVTVASGSLTTYQPPALVLRAESELSSTTDGHG